MKYDKILNEKVLQSIDKEYAKFHASLVPNSTIRGVRIPALRKIAKEFSRFEDFLENVSLDSYESVSVACYYIGLTTKDVDLLKTRLEFILPYVDNWAVCDTFVSSLKILKTKGEEMFSILINYLSSENEYFVRFSIVCLLSYYIDASKIEFLFENIIPLQNRSYYIDMAIAWFVSVAFVKCREQTLKLLKSKSLNKSVQSKSISKICDSFRVNDADKKIVKSLRYN